VGLVHDVSGQLEETLLIGPQLVEASSAFTRRLGTPAPLQALSELADGLVIIGVEAKRLSQPILRAAILVLFERQLGTLDQGAQDQRDSVLRLTAQVIRRHSHGLLVPSRCRDLRPRRSALAKRNGKFVCEAEALRVEETIE